MRQSGRPYLPAKKGFRVQVNLNQASPKSQAQISSEFGITGLTEAEGLRRWSRTLAGILWSNERHLLPGSGFTGKLTRKDFSETLKKITRCGSILEIRRPLDKSTGEIGNGRIFAGNYCGAHSVCPHCARRVQNRRMARFLGPIEAAANRLNHAYMVTFTLPPSKTWAEGLKDLQSARRAFVRMGQKRKGGRGKGEWAKVAGALVKIELKRGSGSGLPHVHAHALVFTNEPFDLRVYKLGKKGSPHVSDWLHPLRFQGQVKAVSKVRLEWFRATQGRALNLDVRPIELTSAHKAEGLTWAQSVAAQSIEVLKYSTKFDSNPEKGQEALFAEDFFAIRDATYSKRLFSTYGIFRGLPEVEFDDDDLAIQVQNDPLYFMAAYNDKNEAYDDLLQVRGPIFPNYGTGEEVSEKYRVLNGWLGKMRRVRSAILKSRDDFRLTGELRPAQYVVKVWNGEKEVERVQYMEPPNNVLQNPHNADAWEMWCDAFRVIAKNGYGQLLDELRQKSNSNEGEELFIASEMKKRPWERGAWYWDSVVKSFREVFDRMPDHYPPAAPNPWEPLYHKVKAAGPP